MYFSLSPCYATKTKAGHCNQLFSECHRVDSVPAAPPPHQRVLSSHRGLEALGLEHCIIQREDGIYADPDRLGKTLLAAFEHVMRGNYYFTDIDYAVLLKAVYDVGPAVPRPVPAALRRRLSSFDAARRALYRAVKMVDGQAEYYFEPVSPTRTGGGAAA